MAATLSGNDRDSAAQIIALFSVLVHSWLTSNFEEAGRTAAELKSRGVTVKLSKGSPRREEARCV